MKSIPIRISILMGTRLWIKKKQFALKSLFNLNLFNKSSVKKKAKAILKRTLLIKERFYIAIEIYIYTKIGI
jgi:hypothetical protein